MKSCHVCSFFLLLLLFLYKIGLMGLVEVEWIETLATLERGDVIYTDFVESAKQLVPQLQKEVHGMGHKKSSLDKEVVR